jgi:hypothetical protein
MTRKQFKKYMAISSVMAFIAAMAAIFIGDFGTATILIFITLILIV